MTRYAYLRDGVTVEHLFEVEERLIPFAKQYHPEYAAHCRPAGPEVEPGWVWDGSAFAPPPGPTPEEAAAAAEQAGDRALAAAGLLKALEILGREIIRIETAGGIARSAEFQALIDRFQEIRNNVT